ncbi:aldehyde dehydrogenase family protein [Desertibacillus haloalkaliphilus]|uniref:aldehyde dehydrogenase family protein n=1 Tax=Desertibacillus haloalkaliphilus TaxID=1328930 RepID=UPI001C272A9C|nr:aldehyde dehydrogenase family protein [Desertibacillus haloalkaliphilus]MBU8907344.1 aldehyde dehydrogenase family protein [Desertibacillus haloalkaliphilus]
MKMQMVGQKMLIGGEWIGRENKIEVRNPQDNRLIDTVPAASKEDMLYTIESARQGAEISANLATHERMRILNKAASLILDRSESFARTIALEGSKTIREARKEVKRCAETLKLSAEEARRIHGETIPFDQTAGNEQRVGYYYRFPVGVVAAITPFNDPLNLVAHKVGPAIASGNAIIVKPATLTPLSAIELAKVFVEAGLPKKVLSVITGKGSEIGDTLIESKDVRMISFTGGLETGEDIAKKAGIKKIAMELGSNSPTIILNDANLEQAVDATVSGAFSAAGQNCIGVQRVYIEEGIYDHFIGQFVERTKQYKVGDKLSENTDVGPMIAEKEAIRVEQWVEEAVRYGANIVAGGKRDGAFYEPTVLTNVPEECRLAREEIFGPVVLLYPVRSLNEAIERSNQVNYGLQAGIFTTAIDQAFAAIQQLGVGGIMINDSSDFRIDAMPFGGIKGSGLGREGVKYSIEEMTEPKVVCFKLNSSQ